MIGLYRHMPSSIIRVHIPQIISTKSQRMTLQNTNKNILWKITINFRVKVEAITRYSKHKGCATKCAAIVLDHIISKGKGRGHSSA